MSQRSTFSMNRSRRAVSQSEPVILRQVQSMHSEAKSSGHSTGNLHLENMLKAWDVSKINFLSSAQLETDQSPSTCQATRRSTIPFLLGETTPTVEKDHKDKDTEEVLERFPIHVTHLMNEEQLWGCFYPFSELYADAYSPVTRVRMLKDVPEIVGGVLTRDVVAACLSYLKRTPILGDYVYIKLDLSNKHLVNIEVLQHYKYLVYLDLSSNYLTDLSVLSNLLYLQYLTVSFNRLNTVLEYDTPQWFLTEVNYKFNSVKRIRDLSMFWSITVLDLSHNNIKTISGLESLQYLRRLDLSFNHIQRLENLNNLRLLWLDVSYNNISSYEFSPQVGLWTLYHLEYLNLNENNLTSIKMFAGVTRLQELHVRNNRLGVLLELAVYLRPMRRLAVLDLRANPICSIPGYKEVVVNTFPKLLNLDHVELDPITQRTLKMQANPDVYAFACRRLLRMMYIEQLSLAKVPPSVPAADTVDVPLIVFVGYEAVGKGSLARRLAEECSSNIEIALQHTTYIHHFDEHYRQVTRHKFDDMIANGDFLTYSEINGESYGLSREEACVRPPKVKIVTMNLPSALMLRLRGYRPYIILTTWKDKAALTKRQHERKTNRLKMLEDRSSIEMPLEKSFLQVLVSGRILVTGIINEILLTLPEDKEQSEFVIESECSLLMDSDARNAVQDYARGINILNLIPSDTTSLEEVCNRAYKTNVQNEASLYSLYKESQNTDEYASDINGQSSIQGLSKKSGDTSRHYPKADESSRPKSMDANSRNISNPWKPNINGSKSSKSVTFTSQDGGSGFAMQSSKDGVATELTGLLIDPLEPDQKEGQGRQVRSLSKKFPKPITHQGKPSRTSSVGSLEDGLWLTFLTETGLLQASDPAVYERVYLDTPQSKDDSEHIMKQLAYFRLIANDTCTTNIRDEYDDIHRQLPGTFYDTITMDDPDEAFKKAKRIIREIVESQKHLQPMFDIDFGDNYKVYPTINVKFNNIINYINPQSISFS